MPLQMRDFIQLVENEGVKLTPDEMQILDHLVDAWNLWADLPGKHQDDDDEFRRHLHILQRHVMARLARRAHPEMFGGN